eukprot:15436035-Alexandrium_andersonii.AAC.1
MPSQAVDARTGARWPCAQAKPTPPNKSAASADVYRAALSCPATQGLSTTGAKKSKARQDQH